MVDRPAHPVIARSAATAGWLLVLIGLLAACGDDGGDRPEGLSAEGQRGAELADDKGCSACHRSGAVGPRWEGLFGSRVELDDGSTVVADEAYLTLAITDPGAQTVAGFDLQMPDNDLDDDEVAALVAYIRELGEGTSATGAGG